MEEGCKINIEFDGNQTREAGYCAVNGSPQFLGATCATPQRGECTQFSSLQSLSNVD
jgi:hypothetical protein